LAEFTIPPTNALGDWTYNINKAVNYISSILPRCLRPVIIPSAVLKNKYLQTETAKTFGCEPTLNVWTKKTNPKPIARNKRLRSAGLHVHFGYDKPDFKVNENIVKAFDLLLSVPAVLIEPENDRRLFNSYLSV
jgi:hypothetical protein